MSDQFAIKMTKAFVCFFLLLLSDLSMAQPIFKVYESNLGRAPLSLSASNTHIFLACIENTTDDPFDTGAVIELQKTDHLGAVLDSVFLPTVGWIFDSELLNNHLYVSALLKDTAGHVVVFKFNQQLTLLHTDTLARRDTFTYIEDILFENQRLQCVFVTNGIQKQVHTISFDPITAQKNTKILSIPATTFSNVFATDATAPSNALYTYSTLNPLEVYLGTHSMASPLHRPIRFRNLQLSELAKPAITTHSNNYILTAYSLPLFGSIQGLYVEKGTTNNLIRTDSVFVGRSEETLAPSFFKGVARLDTSMYVLSNHSTIDGLFTVYPAQNFETSYHITRLNNRLQPMWEHIEPTFGNNISPFILAVQPNGDALIAGVVIKPSPGQANYRLFVSRVSANGVASSVHSLENKQERNFQVYPNPGTESIQWKLPFEDDGQWIISIYDSQGQILLSVDGNQKNLTTDFLPSGLYWITLQHPKHGRYNCKWLRL